MNVGILGSEKDFMKFYHANFLDALEEQEIDYKLLTQFQTNQIHFLKILTNQK